MIQIPNPAMTQTVEVPTEWLTPKEPVRGDALTPAFKPIDTPHVPAPLPEAVVIQTPPAAVHSTPMGIAARPIG